MRKLIAVILLLSVVLSLAACDGKKESGGKSEPKIKAWAYHSFEKTVVNVMPKGELSTEYTVYLAKGETEADVDAKLAALSEFTKTLF